MTMAFGIEQLRNTGTPEDTVRANMLQAILDDRGEDIPLPYAQLPVNDKPIYEHSAISLPTSNQLARFAFKDQLEKPIQVTDTDEIERSVELSEAFTAITQPYYQAIWAKLPPLGEKGKSKGFKTLEWKSHEIVGKANVYNTFKAEYKRTPSANVPRSLQIRFSETEKADENDAYITLSFDDTGVSEIRFKETKSTNWNKKDLLLSYLLKGSCSKEQFALYKFGMNNNHTTALYATDSETHLNLRSLPITLQNSSPRHYLKTFEAKSGVFSNVYHFDPQDLFKRKESRIITTHEPTVEPSLILNFIKDLLSIIPMEQIS